MLKYARAFVKTVQLMAKGEGIQESPVRYPKLQAWIDEGLRLVNAAIAVADQYGMDKIARETYTIPIRKRPMSMEVILTASQHNLGMEYPMLIQANLEHSLTTLYALNLDDQFRVTQLLESELPAPICAAIKKLAEHLVAIPPSNDLDEA